MKYRIARIITCMIVVLAATLTAVTVITGVYSPTVMFFSPIVELVGGCVIVLSIILDDEDIDEVDI